MNFQLRILWVWFPSGSFFCWILLYANLPLTLLLLQSTPLGISCWFYVAVFVHRIGHEIWVADGKEALMPYVRRFAFILTSLYSFCSELDAVLSQLGYGFAPSGPHVTNTSDTSVVKSEASQAHRPVHLKWTYKLKVWGVEEMGQFSVTGPTDAVCKPSHFFSHLPKKTCPYWKTAAMKFWGLFKVLKTFPRTIGSDSGHLAGGYWIPIVTSKWEIGYNDNVSAFSELFWSSETESISLVRISLLLILETQMSRWQCWQMCRHWSKRCNWAALTGLLTNCGHSSLWPPVE